VQCIKKLFPQKLKIPAKPKSFFLSQVLQMRINNLGQMLYFKNVFAEKFARNTAFCSETTAVLAKN
jgi:hypothetical protein